MKVTLKLYASLTQYLPDGAKNHQIELDLPQPASPLQLLANYGVPGTQVHLVLINGVFVVPSERENPMKEGDELAVWPAIAGG